MNNDPELKAMSEVYDALKGLDADTRKRVADWVLNKLGDAVKTTRRGRKPGAKKAAKKAAGKKAGKRGRPKGSTKKSRS